MVPAQVEPALATSVAVAAPGRVQIKDVGVPSPGHCECPGNGRDQVVDLFMEFDTEKVIELLEASTTGELVLTGTLLDGTPIEGVDCLSFRPEPDWMRDGGPAIHFSARAGGAVGRCSATPSRRGGPTARRCGGT